MSVPFASGSAWWFATRGSGAVSLVLLTLSVALGIVNVQRWKSPRWPRFVTDALHRNISLLVLVFVAVHVVSAIADSFAPVSLLDTVVPFGGTYRPLWLGLGAIAFDLLLALTVTSLLRRHIGQRAWRTVHWFAYACWPVALAHGLGTGSDPKRGWMLALAIACTVVVWLAMWVRVSASHPRTESRRRAAVAGLVAAPLALALWLAAGPLGANWARRAGTPVTLLGEAPRANASTGSQTATADPLAPPFRARLTGTLGQSATGDGREVALEMPLRLEGSRSARLDIRIVGEPAAGGGVAMRDSRVTLGPESTPRLYEGRVTALNGSTIVASVIGPRARRLHLEALLNIDTQTRAVVGNVDARQETG